MCGEEGEGEGRGGEPLSGCSEGVFIMIPVLVLATEVEVEAVLGLKTRCGHQAGKEKVYVC